MTHNLLNIILDKVDQVLRDQPYLIVLYKAILSTTYYGLFRIGEVVKTSSQHFIRVKDVHIGTNKKKLMFVLHTSKTHDQSSKPQIIKISSLNQQMHKKSGTKDRENCPYCLIKDYILECRKEKSETEAFFIFKD